MDGISPGALANELGTSVPRVHRAIQKLGLAPQRTPGGHLRIPYDDAQEIRRCLGAVSLVNRLSRQQLLVLTALSRRPFGLRSERAVARASGVSPTAAGAALGRLEELGYISHRPHLVIEGSVHSVMEWEVAFASPAWRGVAPAVRKVELPQARRQTKQPRGLPRRLSHLFWDVPHPERIDWSRHGGATVALRLLASNDPRAHAWAAAELSPWALDNAGLFRGVPPEIVAFAHNLARQ